MSYHARSTTNDRCYRMVTPEGTTPVLCDMHRDGGPEAAGEKCPYYCDQVDCRRAARYEVEGEFYCAQHATLVLQQVQDEEEAVKVEHLKVPAALVDALDEYYHDRNPDLGAKRVVADPVVRARRPVDELPELIMLAEVAVDGKARFLLCKKDGVHVGYVRSWAVLGALEVAEKMQLGRKTP